MSDVLSNDAIRAAGSEKRRCCPTGVRNFFLGYAKATKRRGFVAEKIIDTLQLRETGKLRLQNTTQKTKFFKIPLKVSFSLKIPL